MSSSDLCYPAPSLTECDLPISWIMLLIYASVVVIAMFYFADNIFTSMKNRTHITKTTALFFISLILTNSFGACFIIFPKVFYDTRFGRVLPHIVKAFQYIAYLVVTHQSIRLLQLFNTYGVKYLLYGAMSVYALTALYTLYTFLWMLDPFYEPVAVFNLLYMKYPMIALEIITKFFFICCAARAFLFHDDLVTLVGSFFAKQMKYLLLATGIVSLIWFGYFLVNLSTTSMDIWMRLDYDKRRPGFLTFTNIFEVILENLPMLFLAITISIISRPSEEESDGQDKDVSDVVHSGLL